MSAGFSQSESQQSNFVDPAQAPFLQRLRQSAERLQGQQAAGGVGTQGFFDQAIDPLQQAGAGALDNAGALATGQNPLQQQLATASQQGNPFIQQVIQNTQGDISRNLNQNILPAIGSAAGLAGQRGSSRHGIAEGLALQDAQRLSAEAATNINFQGFGQQLDAARSGLQSQQAGIAQLPATQGAQLGLAEAQVSSPFKGLQNLQGLLGNITTLGQGDSSSKAFQGGA